MINNSLEKLFSSIENSALYKEYKNMANILDKDNKIKELINEIKELEKQATYLEYLGDEKYKEIDEEIKRKAAILNSKHIYQEYLNKMEEFNNELAISSKMIENYVSEKV